MKKAIAALIFAVALNSAAFAAVPPETSAKRIVLTDAATGRVLYQKNAFEKAAMASTTKIMTAILAIENCPLDSSVTISPRASGVEGSSMWLKTGETLTVKELLLGLMLKSGNDAAVALAEAVGGSVESFVALMNAKAREIGMLNTSFETPNGLDGENHFSTAYDMAALGRYAMKNPTFREIVSLKNATVHRGGDMYDLQLKNHNKLLWSLNGCTGIKTGYTKKAGRCLVSSVMQDGRELICASLNAPDDWRDHELLYEYGFKEYEAVKLADKNCVWSRIGVGDKETELLCAENFIASLKAEEIGAIEYQTEVLSPELPVKKGQKLGRVYIFVRGDLLGGVDLLAAEDIAEEYKFKDYLKSIAKELI